ncbi:MAG: hypothetical protein RIF33_25190 [Cyclobacteriaceae bacterium]
MLINDDEHNQWPLRYRTESITNMGLTLKIKTNSSGPNELRVNKSKGEVMGNFNVFIIEDTKHIVAYCPVFEMTGYGQTEDEANEMLKESITEYFAALLNLKEKQLVSELASLGWHQDKYAHKQFVSDAVVGRDGVLRNFDLPENTRITEQQMSTA